MMHIFNAKDNVMYSVIKSYFEVSDEVIYETIRQEFEILKKRLACKKIAYDQLKGALIPNQEADKYETCLIFDSTLIDDDWYGLTIFNALIPLLDKKSTCSILCGDYIDTLNKRDSTAQYYLRKAIDDVLIRRNSSRYQHSSQYYLIYFNRLTANQREGIVEGLVKYPWFTGYADVTHNSPFKSYISTILVHAFIKQGKQIIASHPSDYLDEENINMTGYPFEEHGFKFVSINEDSFMPFLSYKIESIVSDEDDVGFSFNAIFPKFDSLRKLDFVIDDKKWYEYLTCKEPQKKGEVLASMGYGPDDRDRFIKEVYTKICSSYIYNLRENEFGDLLFNVCVELPTINGHYRKTMIALKYHPDSGKMSIVTVT